MARKIMVSMDASDAVAQAEFWKQVLGYVDPPPPPGSDTWRDWMIANDVPEDERDRVRVIIDPEGVRPRLYIQRVPEPKTAKNRFHLDVHLEGPEEEADARLESAVVEIERLGGKRLWEKNEFGVHWWTLADPEGNEFCVS